MKSLRRLGGFATAAAFAAAMALPSLALAQNVQAPLVPSLHAYDAVHVVPNGNPGPANVYANAGQIGAMDSYQIIVPVTGFSFTPASNITLLILNPAGTLATGTLTMPATPSDGGRFCVMSTQTQTALTVSANTGQSLVGTAVTALVANAPPKCWRYVAPLGDWFALQ